MMRLEVFIHRGCLSEQAARLLADEIQQAYPSCQIEVIDSQDHVRRLGLIALPAFVVNGHLLAVGVPRKEWLIGRLREVDADEHTERLVTTPGEQVLGPGGSSGIDHRS